MNEFPRTQPIDSFGVRRRYRVGGQTASTMSRRELYGRFPRARRLPVGRVILLENILRQQDGVFVTEAHIVPRVYKLFSQSRDYSFGAVIVAGGCALRERRNLRDPHLFDPIVR